jgi:hypothetical protein
MWVNLAHLVVDEESWLGRQAEMTSANVYDSRLGEALIQSDEQSLCVDRTYDSQALVSYLSLARSLAMISASAAALTWVSPPSRVPVCSRSLCLARSTNRSPDSARTAELPVAAW